jgi:putative alpha-1,2-mannosidase
MLVSLSNRSINTGLNHNGFFNHTDEDYCVYKIAQIMAKADNVTNFLYQRSQNNPFTIWNNATGFMEARNANGSWAGPDACWTEGQYLQRPLNVSSN